MERTRVGRETQALTIALTSSPEKCGEGPKSSRVPSEAPGVRSWDSPGRGRQNWRGQASPYPALGCAHALGSHCGFPITRAGSQRSREQRAHRRALAKACVEPGARGLSESKGRPDTSPRRQALQARGSGRTPQHTAGPGPGTRDTPGFPASGSRGGWGGVGGASRRASPPFPPKFPAPRSWARARAGQ